MRRLVARVSPIVSAARSASTWPPSPACRSSRSTGHPAAAHQRQLAASAPRRRSSHPAQRHRALPASGLRPSTRGTWADGEPVGVRDPVDLAGTGGRRAGGGAPARAAGADDRPRDQGCHPARRAHHRAARQAGSGGRHLGVAAGRPRRPLPRSGGQLPGPDRPAQDGGQRQAGRAARGGRPAGRRRGPRDPEPACVDLRRRSSFSARCPQSDDDSRALMGNRHARDRPAHWTGQRTSRLRTPRPAKIRGSIGRAGARHRACVRQDRGWPESPWTRSSTTARVGARSTASAKLRRCCGISSATRPRRRPRAGGHVVVDLEPGANEVAMHVRDDGPGIPSEYRDRVFEPFFTTKNRGNGLGLATVINLVHDHRGSVQLESEPGQGTCLTVRLPYTADRGRPSSPSRNVDEAVPPVPCAAIGSITPMQIEVCGSCYQRALDGAVALHATAEFVRCDPIRRPLPASSPPRRAAPARIGLHWCGKLRSEVKKLTGQRGRAHLQRVRRAVRRRPSRSGRDGDSAARVV